MLIKGKEGGFSISNFFKTLYHPHFWFELKLCIDFFRWRKGLNNIFSNLSSVRYQIELACRSDLHMAWMLLSLFTSSSLLVLEMSHLFISRRARSGVIVICNSFIWEFFNLLNDSLFPGLKHILLNLLDEHQDFL